MNYLKKLFKKKKVTNFFTIFYIFHKKSTFNFFKNDLLIKVVISPKKNVLIKSTQTIFLKAHQALEKEREKKYYINYNIC